MSSITCPSCGARIVSQRYTPARLIQWMPCWMAVLGSATLGLVLGVALGWIAAHG